MNKIYILLPLILITSSKGQFKIGITNMCLTKLKLSIIRLN